MNFSTQQNQMKKKLNWQMRIKSLSTLHQLAPISEKSHLRKQFTKLNLCAHLDTLCDCKSKLIDNFFFSPEFHIRN